MNEREEELRALGGATLYGMEVAGRAQGAGDRLLVFDSNRDAFLFRVDDRFALSRNDADFEWLAKYAIGL